VPGFLFWVVFISLSFCWREDSSLTGGNGSPQVFMHLEIENSENSFKLR